MIRYAELSVGLWRLSMYISDTSTLVRVCRIARGARLRRRMHPRPTGLVSAALPLSAPSRLRVSRSDARGEMSHEASAFDGVFNPVQQDQSV